MDRNDVQTSLGYILATFSSCLSNLKLPLSYHSTLKVAKTLLDIISIHFNPPNFLFFFGLKWIEMMSKRVLATFKVEW